MDVRHSRSKEKVIKVGGKVMPKMKSKRALMKRIKVTGTGKVVRGHAYRSHLAPHKTTKQKRHLMKGAVLHKTDYKRVKYLIVK